MPSPRQGIQLSACTGHSASGASREPDEWDELDTETAPLLLSSVSGTGHLYKEGKLSATKQKVEVEVLGMTCAACSNSVEKALLKLDGIISASVALLQNKALIEYDSTFINVEAICEAIENAGFDAKVIANAAKNLAGGTLVTGRFRITGLTCAACVASVEGILMGLDGVSSASVGLASSLGEVKYDPNLSDHEMIISAINDAGFEAEFLEDERRDTVQFSIVGMLSDEDSDVICNLFHQMNGVKDFSVDPLLGRVELSFDREIIELKEIVDAIENIGAGSFKVVISSPYSGHAKDRVPEIASILQSIKLSLMFSIPVLFLGIICPRIPAFHHLMSMRCGPFVVVDWLKWAFVTPVQFVIGRRFYLGAYRSLKNMSANMDVLVALGTTAAYVYSAFAVFFTAFTGNLLVTYFETTAMLINFILLGKYLEAVAKGKTSEAIQKLMELAPNTAVLLIIDSDGNILKEKEIDAQLIEHGDILKVYPGSKVPADGLVIWGASHVDESMITGEAVPMVKRVGDTLIGGTLNGSGVLHIRVTRVGQEAALAQIVHLVESAQMIKAPIQKFADFFRSEGSMDSFRKSPKIAPSMLSSDFANLASEAKRMMECGADWLHMDIMDGHFVPNLTVGAPVIQSLRNHTNAFLDCHLMVTNPSDYVVPLAKAGASGFTFHVEVAKDGWQDLVKSIKAAGMQPGVALKPSTPIEDVFPLVESEEHVDMVLVMTVEPGFGGQKFMPEMMDKVSILRQKYPWLDIEVDGGLGPSTIDAAATAGANCIVAGSSVFGAQDPASVIALMRKSVEHSSTKHL